MHNKRHRHALPVAKLSVAVATVIVLLLIAYYTYLSTNGSTAQLPSLNDVNSAFGSNSYVVQAAPKCVHSSLLYNSSLVQNVCTAVYISDQNLSSVPYEITAFSYSFASPSAASAYIANVVPAFNSTPWPAGAKTFGNVSSTNGLTLYYTTVSYRTSTPFQTVATIYVSTKSQVFGISALVSEGQNLTSAKSGAASLLLLEYSRSTSWFSFGRETLAAETFKDVGVYYLWHLPLLN